MPGPEITKESPGGTLLMEESLTIFFSVGHRSTLNPIWPRPYLQSACGWKNSNGTDKRRTLSGEVRGNMMNWVLVNDLESTGRKMAAEHPNGDDLTASLAGICWFQMATEDPQRPHLPIRQQRPEVQAQLWWSQPLGSLARRTGVERPESQPQLCLWSLTPIPSLQEWLL